MANNRALSFTFTTEDQQAIASLKRIEKGFKGLDVQVERSRQTGSKWGSTMGNLAIGAGIGLAVSEFEEAEKAARSTEAVIKSTGNAAEVSAKQQEKLTDELARMAGIDDDIAVAAANMLRTFTEIKGENFGLALASALDIAAMKGQDFATVAEQIGKALNDPVAGMGKLAKQGVVLSDSQKQLVRDLASVGDTAGAQKVILDELEREYGGQAEAAATSSGKMKAAFGEAAESVGAVLAPAMEAGADAVGGVAGALGSVGPGAQTAIVGLGLAGVAAKKAEGFIGGLDDGLGSLDSSLSKVDKALIGATAGLVAFTGTTELLENASKFKGDVSDLATDLADYAAGTASAKEATTELGGGIDSLARSFGIAFDKSGYADRAGGVLGFFTPGAVDSGDIRQAEEDIKALDEALSTMVDSGQAEEARIAYGKLSQELIDAGVPIEDIARFLPEYTEAQDRATRATEEQTAAVDASTDATKNWYGATDEQTTALFDQKNELHDLNDELQTNIDLIWESTDANLAMKAAHDSVQDAQVALAEARNNGSLEEQQRAEDDLTAAVLREVEAADKLARKNAEATGTTYDAATSANVQREKLKELMSQTGLTSDEVIWFAAQLDNAAREREVQIYTAAAEERLKRVQTLMAEIAELSATLTPFGVSALSGTAGAAVQQSEAYNNANGTTPPRRSLAPSVVVNGDLNVGGSKRDLDRAMDRASRNAGRGILVGS